MRRTRRRLSSSISISRLLSDSARDSSSALSRASSEPRRASQDQCSSDSSGWPDQRASWATCRRSAGSSGARSSRMLGHPQGALGIAGLEQDVRLLAQGLVAGAGGDHPLLAPAAGGAEIAARHRHAHRQLEQLEIVGVTLDQGPGHGHARLALVGGVSARIASRASRGPSGTTLAWGLAGRSALSPGARSRAGLLALAGPPCLAGPFPGYRLCLVVRVGGRRLPPLPVVRPTARAAASA